MTNRQRGATLVEVLISLAIVLVGMAGLFRVLASSIAGSTAASRISQAQLRAQLILESIRVANTDTLTSSHAYTLNLSGTASARRRIK